MKVQNITDIEGFFKVVDSCEGQPAAAHADLAILHRVLVEAVEGLLGGLRVVLRP